MLAINENALSKGHLRKLTALRKSLGQDIADKAFAEWQASIPEPAAPKGDKNAEAIEALLSKHVLDGKIKLPRGGYLLRRGRGRVIVELGPNAQMME